MRVWSFVVVVVTIRPKVKVVKVDWKIMAALYLLKDNAEERKDEIENRTKLPSCLWLGFGR
jgi:hypothetical protein